MSLNKVDPFPIIGAISSVKDPTTVPAWKINGTLAAAERAALVRALKICDQNITLAATRLQVSRSSMYRLIARYDITARPDIPNKKMPRAKTRKRISHATSPGITASNSKVVKIGHGWFITQA